MTQPCIKSVTAKNLLPSTGSSGQCWVETQKEGNPPKRGDVFIRVTDLLWCAVETNTALQSNCAPININQKKRKTAAEDPGRGWEHHGYPRSFYFTEALIP